MSDYAVQSFLWFVFVIVGIPMLLWLLKKSPVGKNLMNRQTGALTKVIASTALGNQQRIVTVEVGQGEERQWLVLGVTPHHINTLHVLPPQEMPQQPEAVPPKAAANFAALLNRSLRK